MREEVSKERMERGGSKLEKESEMKEVREEVSEEVRKEVRG